jgi:two-component system sensor histidine kinase QseC
VSDLQGLALVARAVAEALPEGDEPLATAIVRAAESECNVLRSRARLPELRDMLFRLDSLQGRTLYATPAMLDLPAPTAPGRATLQLRGRTYWSVVHEARGWRVQVLEPAIDDMAMLHLINEDLLQPMLIAFPFVLLPLWLAVRRGLLPLRELVGSVQARDPGDFSPLGLHLRYAELQPLVAAFNALLERSRQGIEREKGFVQDAAHELRTPLAVVAAQAHRLAHAGPSDRPLARRAVEHAVERASHLVQQLLTLASLDRAGADRARDVDLVEEVRAILIAAAPRAAQRQVEVGFDSPDRLAVRLDMAAFHSVLENLLNNACAYCPAGARVAVVLEADAARLRLTVADNGPGIAPDEQSQIFERFYRGRAAASSGAGLGLSIVRQALDRLGGRMAMGPGLDGAGVGFAVEIPRSPESARAEVMAGAADLSSHGR